MAETGKPVRRRARRSTEVSRRLQEARRRDAEQLKAQREKERRVEEGLDAYFTAADLIEAAEQECQRRIEPHERAIAELREQRDAVVAEQETAQGRAALAIHDADRTVEQVGELLELGEKSARRLIAAGRAATAAGEPTRRSGGASMAISAETAVPAPAEVPSAGPSEAVADQGSRTFGA
ncbi:hypothetical protein [Amycolatopsis magusensis]|uniref:hypothetical protein n=1 Tax=Amycolatopsis magusensis TaxID=882444 RepID=UPI0037A16F0C